MKPYKPPFTIKWYVSPLFKHDPGLGSWVLWDTEKNEKVELRYDPGLGRDIGGNYNPTMAEKLTTHGAGAPPRQLLDDLTALNKPSHEHYKANVDYEGMAFMGKDKEIIRDDNTAL